MSLFCVITHAFWAFEQIVSNNFNTEQIWKMVREKADGKGRFSKNNLWVSVRNPLYCGKIFIPPYKDEKGYFVKGQHEPLISEKTFADVQDILDGRKRLVKPKIVVMDNLPLRWFIKCPNPNCNRMLTGSASKGKVAITITTIIALPPAEYGSKPKPQMKFS